jgi:hypothetical protein
MRIVTLLFTVALAVSAAAQTAEQRDAAAQDQDHKVKLFEQATQEAKCGLPLPRHTFKELEPELTNRCFQSKPALMQWELLRELDALPMAEFDKTISDLNLINAADRLTGDQGCELRSK